jgi:all-trans-retinol 13,14-reductase
MAKYDVIIIGSGIGGLATGLMLSQKGKKILLIEKNRML